MKLKKRANHDAAFIRDVFARCGKLMETIIRIPQPVIARVHGIATAAGCQFVAQCDLAVAADNTRFAVSGINVGLFCSTPAVPLSRNLSGASAPWRCCSRASSSTPPPRSTTGW